MSRHINNYTVTAPAIFADYYNEAEILGSVTWLWMHSESHRDAPLHTLPKLLLPAIKTCQFVFASDGQKPVFYMSWANMSQAAERRYIENPPVCMPEEDWMSGDRRWILDWVAPFGHTGQMRKILSEHVFPDAFARALHHNGTKIGMRILQHRGKNVSYQDAKTWFSKNPVQHAIGKVSTT